MTAPENEPRVAIDVVNATIERLFAIGLVLAPWASAVTGPADGVLDAIDQLDEVIRDLRTAVFDELCPRPPSRAGIERMNGGASSVIATELYRLAAETHGIVHAEDAAATLALEDAARAMCRAGVALREARAVSLAG